jgi:hypothetical protein
MASLPMFEKSADRSRKCIAARLEPSQGRRADERIRPDPPDFFKANAGKVEKQIRDLGGTILSQS